MLYSLIIFTGSSIARILSIFHKKTRRFFTLRKDEVGRIEEHFKGIGNKKVIWFHAASAGEFEQAKPVIEKIRECKDDYYIVTSFFSSSGYDAGLKYANIDFCFNFPLDYLRDIKRLLDCINPGLIVYSKYDVWKNLTLEASRRGVKILLMCGTLPKQSNRHRWPFRIFFRRIYSQLDRIYAISEFDSKRFNRMLGNDSNVIINGDTRFDRIKTVIERKYSAHKEILKKEEGINYLLAGSTYKVSEKKLIKSFKDLISQGEKIRLVLVPHEVDSDNILRLKKYIRKKGLVPVCYSGSDLPISLKSNEVLIIDAFGILAYLYNEADIVFVGGSYKGSTHSVLEPAIFGIPIITGPYIGNSYEAIALMKMGGIKICRNSDDLKQEILRLIHDKEYKELKCSKVKDYFNNSQGATGKIFSEINKYL